MINFVVALASEARPLIEHYTMSLCESTHGFRVYVGDTARLVITGIGKMQAAAGTAYLAGLSARPARPWLNVGIAGHRSLPTGTATFALKITDKTTDVSWYPPQIADIPGIGVHVTTFDYPVTAYPADTVCEMEAAAFYSVATRFSTSEVVQCYKVISDNRSADVSDLTSAKIEQFVGDHISEVDRVAQSLSGLTEDLLACVEDSAEFVNFVDRWHFTVAQKAQLRQALRKGRARGAWEIFEIARWQQCRSASRVLSEIEAYLRSLPVTL